MSRLTIKLNLWKNNQLESNLGVWGVELMSHRRNCVAKQFWTIMDKLGRLK